MKKYKYFHMVGSINNAVFAFLDIISEQYDAAEHIVYMPVGTKSEILSYSPKLKKWENLIIAPCARNGPKRYVEEFRLLLQSEHIIIHYLIFGTRPLFPILLLLYISPKFRKRLAWIEGGGDLYEWKTPGESIKIRFRNVIHKYLRKKIPVYGLTHPADEVFARQEFNKEATCVYTQMRSSDDPLARFEKLRPKAVQSRAKQHVRLRVQVGNNAFQRSNHIAILDRLEKFQNEDIQVVLPLSYGTVGTFASIHGGIPYFQAVRIVASILFGKKVTIMRKEIPWNNYHRYLWNTDIIVLDLMHPAAFGNMHAALYMNKKIFLPSGTIMYDWFFSQGLEIYDTNQIPNMSWDEFKQGNKTNRNAQWVREFLTDNSYGLWDVFFRTLEDTLQVNTLRVN